MSEKLENAIKEILIDNITVEHDRSRTIFRVYFTKDILDAAGKSIIFKKLENDDFKPISVCADVEDYIDLFKNTLIERLELQKYFQKN